MGTINVTSGIPHRYNQMTFMKGGSVISVSDRQLRDMIGDYGVLNDTLLASDLAFNNSSSDKISVFIGEQGQGVKQDPTQPPHTASLINIEGSGVTPTLPSGVSLPSEFYTDNVVPNNTVIKCGETSLKFKVPLQILKTSIAAWSLTDFKIRNQFGTLQTPQTNSLEANLAARNMLFEPGNNANSFRFFPSSNSNYRSNPPDLVAGDAASLERQQLICKEFFEKAKVTFSANNPGAKITCAPCSNGTKCKKVYVWGGLESSIRGSTTYNLSVYSASVSTGTQDRSGYYPAAINSVAMSATVILFVYCDDSDCPPTEDLE
jgi:hypothetical protein